MFIGEYHHRIDNKGRLAIPTKLRPRLTTSPISTRGFDRSLFIYPKREWLAVAEKLEQFPIANPQSRAFVRMIFAGAAELEFDRQGRVLLPQVLRDYASLKTRVVITGLGKRIEVWDFDLWQKYKLKTVKDENAIDQKMEELGF